jgi:hypothetical protein
VRFARFSVGEKDHQTFLLRLSNLLRNALAPYSPLITPGNFWYKTTWPEFQLSLPRALKAAHYNMVLASQTGPEPCLHRWGMKPTRLITI